MPISEEDVGSGQKSEDELEHELSISNIRWIFILMPIPLLECVKKSGVARLTL
jgi:hypothetical protein